MSENTGYPSNFISVEPLQRRLIQEFTWNAEEIYEEKLSLSDQLTRNVRRLQFSRDLDTGVFQSEGERRTEERDKTQNLAVGISQSKTELQAPRETMRKALMEISALNDLLEIINKCPRYLLLKSVGTDPVQTPLDQPLLPHKRATCGKSLIKARETLRNAAAILMKGANDLNSCFDAKNGNEHAFHNCLWSLREKWRLVRNKDHIMGDLTYTSAGARIHDKGRFLVRKTADSSQRDRATSDAMDTCVSEVAFCPVTLDIPQELLTRSALLVYLHFEPVRCSPQLEWEQMERDGWYGLCPPPDLPVWQRQLYEAQLTFFHREVFSQLMIDAYSPQQVRPVYVCDGQLHIQLREHRWLSLHCIQQSDTADTKQDTADMEQIPEPNRALYLFVCDALRQLHKYSERVPHPVPAPSPFAPLERRLDGPKASHVPASEDSISSSKGKHSATHPQQLSNHWAAFEPTSVLNKLQEAILQTDLLEFIGATCRLVNSELKMCPILVELILPPNMSPAQSIVPICERYRETELTNLKLEQKTGTMFSIVPIETEQRPLVFSVDSKRFVVFLRRLLLSNWTQQIVQSFSQDPEWLLLSVSPLQPCLPTIHLSATLSFLHNVSARVVNVSLSYPDTFLLSTGFESGNFGCDRFPVVRMESCQGNSLQEKLNNYLSSFCE